MEKFTIGLVLGVTAGALLTANSCKMRALVRKGQEEIKQRLDEMMDEKLKELDESGCRCSEGEGERNSQKSEEQGSNRSEKAAEK